MSVYDLHFNKDDATIRNIIIGLLATLYDNISWYNQIGTKFDEKKLIKVPFYFSTTGQERYLQDNFLNNVDFDPDGGKAETFYEKIPRGIVDLSGLTIETQAIVNKYVRMKHQIQENDGSLNTYNSEAFMVPIIMNTDVVVYLDSTLDQFKCTEAIIQTFFKNKEYQIDTALTRIPCLVTFPDEYNNERTVEFGFSDRKEFKVSFSLQVKSHIPIFKEGSAIFAGTTMEGFQSNTMIPPVVYSAGNGGQGDSFDGSSGSSSGNAGISGASETSGTSGNDGGSNDGSGNDGSGKGSALGNGGRDALQGNNGEPGNSGQATNGGAMPSIPSGGTAADAIKKKRYKNASNGDSNDLGGDRGWPINPSQEFPPKPKT